jgi:HD-GYP domain-containing protein (c-di-GMP phosphodiesterase class II)
VTTTPLSIPAPPPPVAGDIKLSEVISALSYALDITEGQPEGHAVKSCFIGMRLAEEIGLSPAERSGLFYALLLKDAGCSSNAAKTCMLFGADDLEVKRDWKTVDWQSRWQAFLHVARNVVPEESPIRRAMRVVSFATQGAVGTELIQTRCERGADIARMLGFGEETAAAIRTLDEHWNGEGSPEGLAGEAIPLFGRIACLAQTVEIFFTTYGRQAACDVARERSGRWFDPALVWALGAVERDTAFWERLAGPDVRRHVAGLEPEEQVLLADDAALDRVARAFAQVIDAKSPYTYRHSERMAEIAVRVGGVLGLPAPRLRDLERAGLLHDLGKLGVSNLILDKPGKLTEEEMAQVRLHPEYTLRILERVAAFRELAEVAASHHERMDGRGYHRGLRAGDLPLEARILAVADIFEALSAERPYRGALPTGRVLEIMRADVGAATCPVCFEALVSVV